MTHIAFKPRGSLVVVCVWLCACSPQIRMLKEPSAGGLIDYDWVVQAPDGVSATLHAVLVRDGPGSWVRDADWDEYVLTLKNASSSRVQIEAIELESPYLPSAQQNSLSAQQLTDRSRETLKNERDAAAVVGSTAVFAGTTMAVAGAGYAGSMVALPLAATTLPWVGEHVDHKLALRRNREHQDASLIELTVLERGMHLPMDVPAGADATRSAFFPITPAPNRLVIDYRMNGERRELQMALPALAQLHIKSGAASR